MLTLYGMGDVGPLVGPMSHYPALIRDHLRAADLRFANCERLYTHRGTHQNNGHDYNRLDPSWAELFTDCGFDVLSLAANHAMDMGAEGLLGTLETIRGLGIRTVGAGENIAEARKPAIVERAGVTVAFLAYCSILKEGHAATDASPGVAPLRVTTYHRPIDEQPGVPARPVTIADRGDLSRILEDIRAAKQRADVVVVSMHWGVHFIPRLLADYQIDCAEEMSKAGADLILGHHAHLPKGVTIHNGMACFHSLGNFMITSPPFTPEQARRFCRKYEVELDPDYPQLRYGRNAHRTMIAKVMINREGVQKVSMLPVLVDKQLRPELIMEGDERFSEAAEFLMDLSRGLGVEFEVGDGEIMIGTGTASPVRLDKSHTVSK